MWAPPFEWRDVSLYLMMPVFALVLAGNLGDNHLRRWFRHPMLLGVLLWGLAHLWSNGDAASMLLFGSFALWAGIKYAARFREGPVDAEPRPVRTVAVLVVGAALFVVFMIFHGQLFGVALVV